MAEPSPSEPVEADLLGLIAALRGHARELALREAALLAREQSLQQQPGHGSGHGVERQLRCQAQRDRQRQDTLLQQLRDRNRALEARVMESEAARQGLERKLHSERGRLQALQHWKAEMQAKPAAAAPPAAVPLPQDQPVTRRSARGLPATGEADLATTRLQVGLLLLRGCVAAASEGLPVHVLPQLHGRKFFAMVTRLVVATLARTVAELQQQEEEEEEEEEDDDQQVHQVKQRQEEKEEVELVAELAVHTLRAVHGSDTAQKDHCQAGMQAIATAALNFTAAQQHVAERATVQPATTPRLLVATHLLLLLALHQPDEVLEAHARLAAQLHSSAEARSAFLQLGGLEVVYRGLTGASPRVCNACLFACLVLCRHEERARRRVGTAVWLDALKALLRPLLRPALGARAHEEKQLDHTVELLWLLSGETEALAAMATGYLPSTLRQVLQARVWAPASSTRTRLERLLAAVDRRDAGAKAGTLLAESRAPR